MDANKLKKGTECLEGELLGTTSVGLRNLGGMLAVLTTCAISVVNAFVTYHSVVNGHGWPSDITMVITNIGTLIIGWTFMRSGFLISTILMGEGGGNRFRRKLSHLIDPDTDAKKSN